MARWKYAPENVKATPVELSGEPPSPKINVFDQFGSSPTPHRNIEIGGGGFWCFGHYYLSLIVDDTTKATKAYKKKKQINFNKITVR